MNNKERMALIYWLNHEAMDWAKKDFVHRVQKKPRRWKKP